MFDILIIIPTKDSWKKLKILVKSLVNQTDKNFRVIFVDSNSSKDHKNYLKKLNKLDQRFSYINQSNNNTGIYGAMNDGFKYAKKNEWLLFWGSDDFASCEDTIFSLRNFINNKDFNGKDIVLFKGHFYDHENKKLVSKNHFSKLNNLTLDVQTYRKILLRGFRQAHQGTLINPNNNLKKLRYDFKYSLAADLNYYLESSHLINSKIYFYNKHLVNIGIGGISRQKHILRTFQVMSIYWKEFKLKFLLSIIFRYLKKL